MITTQSTFKLQLIAFGLLFLIPVTINLGIDLIYPAITWQDLEQAKEKYLEENIPNYDQQDYQKYKFSYPDEHEKKWDKYKKQIKEWNESSEYQDLQDQKNKQAKFKFIILTFVILLLMLILNFITIPIVAASMIGAMLSLFLFELTELATGFHQSIQNGAFLGIPLPIIGIATSFICLIVIIHLAYKDQ